MKHPAKYTDKFIPVFAEILSGLGKVYDPFGGTGKIGKIKDLGFTGEITICEIEPEWVGNDNIDRVIISDAADTPELNDSEFDAICTSPTYGNRMADHFDAKDGSKRITYRHYLGRPLDEKNTGRMQWGKKYRDKHLEIYTELKRVLKSGGLFVLNMSDHIRAGAVIKAVDWHIEALTGIGFVVVNDMEIPTPRMGFGQNAKARVQFERVVVLRLKAKGTSPDQLGGTGF